MLLSILSLYVVSGICGYLTLPMKQKLIDIRNGGNYERGIYARQRITGAYTDDQWRTYRKKMFRQITVCNTFRFVFATVSVVATGVATAMLMSMAPNSILTFSVMMGAIASCFLVGLLGMTTMQVIHGPVDVFRNG